MAKNDTIQKQTDGAWIIHHGQKVAADVDGASEFPALDTAAKAASLLSQLAATDEITIAKPQVEALGKAAKLNPKTELPSLLDILEKKKLVDVGKKGDVSVLGITSRATLQHASDIFYEQDPTKEEKASLALAEEGSKEPVPAKRMREYIEDTYKISKSSTSDFLSRAEVIGFVDAEGKSDDKLYFNGNLFRRDNVSKTRRVLDSLSEAEGKKAAEIEALLIKNGCVGLDEAEKVLGGLYLRN